MKYKKAQAQDKGFRAILVAIIIFTALSMGGITFIAGMNSGYSQTLNYSEFNSSFSKIGEMETHSQNIYDTTTTDSEEKNILFRILDGVGQVFDGFVKFISTIVTSIKVASSAATSAEEQFALPRWFIMAIGACISIIVATTILSIVFKKNV